MRPLVVKAISAKRMGSSRPSAMIVLSAITVGIASAVGVATAPGAQAASTRLNPISTMTDLCFIMIDLHGIFALIIRFLGKTHLVKGTVFAWPPGQVDYLQYCTCFA
jgi:hypothetical protein